MLQSAPKPSRPDLSMREARRRPGVCATRVTLPTHTGRSAELARDGGSSKGSKKKEREPALDYVPPVESEYERHRRERIAENQRFLQSLGFVGGDVGIPKEQKKTRGPRKKREPQAPTREGRRAPLTRPASTTRTGNIEMRCNKLGRSSGSRRKEDKKDAWRSAWRARARRRSKGCASAWSDSRAPRAPRRRSSRRRPK